MGAGFKLPVGISPAVGETSIKRPVMTAAKTLFAVGLAATLTVGLMACSAIADGIGGGQCHNETTGEKLSKVADANGDVFPVEKKSIKAPSGLELVYCAVSMTANLEKGNWNQYVFHPETGARIEVDGAYRGFHRLLGYAWY